MSSGGYKRAAVARCATADSIGAEPQDTPGLPGGGEGASDNGARLNLSLRF